jgi:uncharacterized protein YhaN
MDTDAGDIEQHLRAASDAILLLLTETSQLERHKRKIPPGEARFDEIAKSVRAVAQALAEFTEFEAQWARTATDGRTDLDSIDASATTPALASILDRWRAIERQLDEAEPGTPEAAALFAEFERVRAEYMAAFEARHASGSG